jgi:hypothetical protein
VDDPVAILYEPRCLVIEAEVAVGEAKRSHLAVDQSLKLGGAPSDPVVLRQLSPAAFAS